MAKWQYKKGLHHIGGGSFAYLLPNGTWGFSNAGLVVDGDQSLLVDTLFDLKMTAEMLKTMSDAVPASRKIGVLVNSHADGDHTFGNQLVKGARIIASKASMEEFFNIPPERFHSIVTQADTLGEGARYMAEKMGPDIFDFSNITLTPPTEVYEREMWLKVGDKDVGLYNVGPAHTAGDTLVHVVQDRVVYTADLLFLGVHPAIWAGSLDGWLAACDKILAMDIDVVVSGHGPITDKAGVRTFRNYLSTIKEETRKRYDAGLSVEEAAFDIALTSPYDDWTSPERMVGTVNYLYRQFGSQHTLTEFLDIFAALSRYTKRKAECDAGRHTDGCGHAHAGA